MTMYALVENGVVRNIISLTDECAWRFPNAVKVRNFAEVAIGDIYENGKFYRNGEEIVSPLDAAYRKLDILTGVGGMPSTGFVQSLRTKLENLAQKNFDDKDASSVPEFFPSMKYTEYPIAAGTRINWNGQIKRAAVDLWDREDCDPDHAPILWEDINYREGVRIIPSVITVGAAFDQDELGWWGDVLYRSLIANNVWTPDSYSQGWEEAAIDESGI